MIPNFFFLKKFGIFIRARFGKQEMKGRGCFESPYLPFSVTKNFAKR